MNFAAEIDLLEHRLVTVANLLEENEMRLRACPPHGHQYSDYRRQEVEHERRELLYQQHKTKNRLAQLLQGVERAGWIFRRRPKPDTQEQKRIDALNALEAEWADSTLRNCRRAEGEGDHRQARLLRLELVTAREQLARIYHMV